MRIIFFNALLILTGLVQGCKVSPTSSQISANGTLVANSDVAKSATVKVLIAGGLCTGTLMSGSLTRVLTAAHCAVRENRICTNGTVEAGGEKIAISDVKVHEQYKPNLTKSACGYGLLQSDPYVVDPGSGAGSQGGPGLDETVTVPEAPTTVGHSPSTQSVRYDVAILTLTKPVQGVGGLDLGNSTAQTGDAVGVGGFGQNGASDKDLDGITNWTDKCPDTPPELRNRIHTGGQFSGCAAGEKIRLGDTFKTLVADPMSGELRIGANTVDGLADGLIQISGPATTQTNATDTIVAPGDSGSALQNSQGQVIGVLSGGRILPAGEGQEEHSVFVDVTDPNISVWIDQALHED